MAETFMKWLTKHGNSFGPFIDGAFHQSEQVGDSNDSKSKEVSLVINEDMINESIRSSRNASKKWCDCTERGDILRKMGKALKQEAELFAEISLSTHGISCKYSKEVDLSYAEECFSYNANWADKMNVIYNQWKPHGVVGGVFLGDGSPLMTLSWLVAPIIAAGNTVVLLVKPHYALISLAFALTVSKAGIPPGVLNVLPCVDEELFPSVASKLSVLTGVIPNTIKSLPSSITLPAVSTKSSGAIPMLVLNTADVDSAVAYAMDTARFPTLVPWFTNIILVEEPVYESFVSSLINKIEIENRFSSYKHKHESDFEYRKFIKKKESQGFQVLKLVKEYVCCLFLINADDALNSPIITDKVYPPVRVISVTPVRTPDEAITIVNNSDCGLCASLWTNDTVQCTSVPLKLQCGTVWVNSYGNFSPAVSFPFWKNFGFGTFSGKEALLQNLYPSSATIDSTVLKKKQNVYPASRNEIFPKKDPKSAIEASYSLYQAWSATDAEERGELLRSLTTEHKKLWNSHYKMVLTETTEEVWIKGMKYLSFWSSFVTDRVSDKLVNTKTHKVMCISEPLGVICILAGSMPLDILMYLVSAALMFGNTVVVGISSNEKSGVLALELENIFSLISGKINIVVSYTDALWEEFLTHDKVSAIWYAKCYLEYIPKTFKMKNVLSIVPDVDMRHQHEFFELQCTKTKAVWFPFS